MQSIQLFFPILLLTVLAEPISQSRSSGVSKGHKAIAGLEHNILPGIKDKFSFLKKDKGDKKESKGKGKGKEEGINFEDDLIGESEAESSSDGNANAGSKKPNPLDQKNLDKLRATLRNFFGLKESFQDETTSEKLSIIQKLANSKLTPEKLSSYLNGDLNINIPGTKPGQANALTKFIASAIHDFIIRDTDLKLGAIYMLNFKTINYLTESYIRKLLPITKIGLRFKSSKFFENHLILTGYIRVLLEYYKELSDLTVGKFLKHILKTIKEKNESTFDLLVMDLDNLQRDVALFPDEAFTKLVHPELVEEEEDIEEVEDGDTLFEHNVPI